jgi:dUTP pyrophosphatase
MDRLLIKRLREDAVLPARATSGSAGYDLCAVEEIRLAPGERRLVPTGIAIAIGDAHVVGLVYARSGIALKHGIAPINCVGVIDSDYRGELMVPLTNHGSESYRIGKGDRIAQLVFTPVYLPKLEETDQLDETGRGCGGFGSTAK